MTAYFSLKSQVMPIPRIPAKHRHPELPAGYEHPGQWLEELRRDADKKPREIEDLTGAYGEQYRLERTYLSKLENGTRKPFQFGAKKLEALRAVYGYDRTEWERRLGITIPRGAYLENTVPNTARTSRLNEDQRQAQFKALEEVFRDAANMTRVPYWGTGAGPSVSDEEPEGEIAVEDSILERYPNMLVQRVVGRCMEPDYPEGHFAYVVPDPYAAEFTDVLIWFAGNGRVIKRLVKFSDDGDHLVYQRHPEPGETQVFRAPVGSIIIGRVIDVRRGRPPRVSRREIIDAITEENPELLDELDL